jgi:hypothetical protein
MYFMLMCRTPRGAESAGLTYHPDRLPDGHRRHWATGGAFPAPPPEPIRIEILEEEAGLLLEYYDSGISIMSRRLANALKDAGIDNIDFYETEIHDLTTGEVLRSHVAFNLIGAIEAADLGKSKYQALDGPLIAIDFDSLAIDEAKTRGVLMFRLAESTNGVAVHESVREKIEAVGIDTLTFFRPQDWVG